MDGIFVIFEGISCNSEQGTKLILFRSFVEEFDILSNKAETYE